MKRVRGTDNSLGQEHDNLNVSLKDEDGDGGPSPWTGRLT